MEVAPVRRHQELPPWWPMAVSNGSKMDFTKVALDAAEAMTAAGGSSSVITYVGEGKNV